MIHRLVYLFTLFALCVYSHLVVQNLMQQPQASWLHGPAMDRLNLDIAFGIDVAEQYSLNNLLPYLKTGM
jgi:hypothetical protein